MPFSKRGSDDMCASDCRHQPDPIYLCGHSLGGALSTISSLNIVLSLEVTELFITTFGSPKCEYLFWRNIFDELVPSYWRVAMRSDIITTLPYPGYVHVGKRVALTSTGDMFLDPNAIETIIWSQAGLRVKDHTKPAYQEALKLFASKYVPDYDPFTSKMTKLLRILPFHQRTKSLLTNA